MQAIGIEQRYKAFFLYGGMGGAAKGVQDARAEYRGFLAGCDILGSADVDGPSCRDFEMWTGVPATQMDLFDREQYTDWHGHEPPAGWQEVGAEEIRAAAQGDRPDVVIITAPCKGFSGLLGKETAATKKYQALNRLTFRGVFLTMEAWRDDPPAFIFFENVKGLATRGKKFLSDIRRLLEAYGYAVHHEHYDCGEWGGLAQHRKRFKLFARHMGKTSTFCYNPPKQRVKAIGEVLEQMPIPWDPENPPAHIGSAGGPMNRSPRLHWRTWVRLALIPPGGDWRDLQRIQPGDYTIVPIPDRPKFFRIVRTAELPPRPAGPDIFHNVRRIKQWDEPAGAVTAVPGSAKDAPIVADPRQPHLAEGESFPHKYHVQDYAEPGSTVTGSRMGSGMGAIADPRPLGHTPMGKGKGAYHVQDTADAANTVTGDPSHRKAGGSSVIADPRLAHDPRDASMRVGDMTDPSGPVIGAAGVTRSNGMGAVADARYDREPRPGVYAVQDTAEASRAVVGGKDANGNMLIVADMRHCQGKEAWGHMLHVSDSGEPAQAVTAAAGPNQAGALVADPRMGCEPRGNTKGPLGVLDMNEPSGTVLGAGDVHVGAVAVADPRPLFPSGAAWDCRIPGDKESGVWYIISPHTDKKGRHCVHRPMTPLELLAIQGFPWQHSDGRPVVLDGRSDRGWRERIGNAYPPLAARALMEEVLLVLLASETGDFRMDVRGTGVLVVPPLEDSHVA